MTTSTRRRMSHSKTEQDPIIKSKGHASLTKQPIPFFSSTANFRLSLFILKSGIISFILHFLVGLRFGYQIVIVLAVSIVSLALIVGYQESMMYVPIIKVPAPEGSGGAIELKTVKDNPAGYRSPAEYNVDFEEQYIPTKDGEKIHTWLLHTDTCKARCGDRNAQIAVIECHGNAGNFGLRLPSAVAALRNLNNCVCMFDYRGYGDSTGTPSEDGFVLDLAAVHDWLVSKTGHRAILHGRSVGGSLVVEYAARMGHQWVNAARGSDLDAKESPDGRLAASLSSSIPLIPLIGVISENTFTSIPDLACELFPLLTPFLKSDFFIRNFLRLRWDTHGWLRSSFPRSVPILFLSSGSDELIPHLHRKQLFDTAGDLGLKAQLEFFETAGHNDLWIVGGEKYWSGIREWVSGL